MQATDNQDNQDVEVLTEIEIDREIFANGKVVVMEYTYGNVPGSMYKKNCLALCMKVYGIVYMISLSRDFIFDGLRITAVEVKEADSIMIRCTVEQPYNEFRLQLQNVVFSRNPMCEKIVREFENYNNSSEYVLK